MIDDRTDSPSVPGPPPAGRRWGTVIFGLVITACLIASPGHAQLRVVNYNTAQFQGDLTAFQDVLDALTDDDKPGFASPVAVFVFQEVLADDVDLLLQMARTSSPPEVFYVVGTFTSYYEDNYGGAQAMIYDFNRLDEIEAEHEDIYTQAGRYTDRWKLRLLGYDSPDASFYIYSSHLKAGDDPDEEDQRLDGVQSIRSNADALPAGSHIIYAGDMNFYHNQEPGYQWFFSTGDGQAFDPLGTGSWAGAPYAIKHSQSPRLTSSGGLVGGGLDDRFDFQLPTSQFNDDDGLSIIAANYRSLGNDGQHYNNSINYGNNYYYPWDVPRSNDLADDLHEASDHVPLVVDYQVPAVMLAGMAGDFGRVIRDADFEMTFILLNDADVVVPEGADVLDYQAEGSGCLLGTSSGSVEALEGIVEDTLPVDTSQVGPVSGTLTVSSDNEAVQNPEYVLNTSGTIVRPANASFDGQSDMDSLTVEQTYDPDSGVHFIEVNVHNYGYDDLQALLDVDDVSPAESPFGFVGGLAAGIGDEPATLTFSFDTTGLNEGEYPADITIYTSDEDLPGETVSTLDLTFLITIGAGSECPADVNADEQVNIDDLFAVLAAWGICDDCPEDVNDDGKVNIDDVFEILGAWGPCP
ncbi:MAG: hypothetical protein JSV91_10205 [Phycisphaerales bacterium]|nr:MAG: hypothetical protein JSV91_10205 [Phycisphaerales bacterium]